MGWLTKEMTKEQLVTDFMVVVADAEALVKATAHHGGEELAAVRAKAEDSLKNAQSRIAHAQAALKKRTSVAFKETDGYLRENPWLSLGVAVGFGLLFGLLGARR